MLASSFSRSFLNRLNALEISSIPFALFVAVHRVNDDIPLTLKSQMNIIFLCVNFIECLYSYYPLHLHMNIIFHMILFHLNRMVWISMLCTKHLGDCCFVYNPAIGSGIAISFLISQSKLIFFSLACIENRCQKAGSTSPQMYE